MFEIETEDMLPRAAPRPCAGIPIGMGMVSNEQTVKPTVPEVSLIFGTNAPSEVTQSQSNPEPRTQPVSAAPSFASWKKQMLPRVNFSPILATELGPRPSHTHNVNTNLTSSSSGSTVSNEYIIMPREHIYTASATTTPPMVNNCFVDNRRDMDYLPSPRLVSDVLTICASTQTDNANKSPPANTPLTTVGGCSVDKSNLVNKQDMDAVVSLLESIRGEQRQLKELCESIAKQQRAPREPSSRTSTGCQCEIITINQNNNVKRHTPIIQDYIVEEEETVSSNPKPLRALPNQYQSPRPMAQSTGYRANTPNGKIMPMPKAIHHKSNTEKSLVMNELALKYLRQPVDELMKELCVTGDLQPPSASHSPMTEPLRQIHNLAHAQSPNNISNASYKYLKKYRLLPEDEMNPGSSQQHDQPQEPMLDLENIRNQPKLL